MSLHGKDENKVVIRGSKCSSCKYNLRYRLNFIESCRKNKGFSEELQKKRS